MNQHRGSPRTLHSRPGKYLDLRLQAAEDTPHQLPEVRVLCPRGRDHRRPDSTADSRHLYQALHSRSLPSDGYVHRPRQQPHLVVLLSCFVHLCMVASGLVKIVAKVAQGDVDSALSELAGPTSISSTQAVEASTAT